MKGITWLKAQMQAAAAAQGITAVKVGYVQELATGQQDFPAMLLLPPKETIDDPRNWREGKFAIRYYLITLDRGASGGNMTEAERLAAWDALRAKNKAIIAAINASPSSMRVADGGVIIDPDSGGSDGLIPDRVVWIDVQFKVEVDASDC